MRLLALLVLGGSILAAPTVRVKSFVVLAEEGFTEAEVREIYQVVKNIDARRPLMMHTLLVIDTIPEMSTKDAVEFSHRVMK